MVSSIRVRWWCSQRVWLNCNKNMSRIFQTRKEKDHHPQLYLFTIYRTLPRTFCFVLTTTLGGRYIYYCYFIQLAKKTFIKIIYSHSELTTRIKTSVNRFYYRVEKGQVKEKLAFMGNLKMVPIGTESYIIEHSGNQRGRMN